LRSKTLRRQTHQPVSSTCSRAEQGAGPQHARRPIGATLTDFFGIFWPSPAAALPVAETQSLRELPSPILDAPAASSRRAAARPAGRRWRHLFRFLFERADPQRRSGPRSCPGRKRRPRPAKGAVDRGCGSSAGAREGAHRRTGSLEAAAASRRCGYIACWRCSTPPACGYRNWWHCRFRPRGAMPA